MKFQPRSNTSTISSKQNRLRKLGLAFGALIVALLIAEVALRLLGFSYFNPYVLDPEVGFTLKPGAEGWWRKEGAAYIKINSHGLRDYEHSLIKADKTIRIAILGDSFAEAFQVTAEDAFWSVMRRQLEPVFAKDERKTEVLNFGISGFSTGRELIQLRQKVWQYNPDLVVLLVTVINDVKDNSRTLSGYSSALPYFAKRDNILVLDDSLLKGQANSFSFRLQQSAVGSALAWLRSHSRVVGLIYTVRESWSTQNRRVEREKGEAGVDDRIFGPPPDNEWSDAWWITEKLIVEMRNEVQAKGAKLLVVTGSTGIQVNPDANVRNHYARVLGVDNLFYPDMRIKQLCEREGIDVVTLAPLLLNFAERNQTFLHGFGVKQGSGHWNEKGHKVAGEAIATKIEEMLK